MRIALAGFVLVLATVAPALADVETTVQSDCARARKANRVCELTLEAEAVNGERPGAGESEVAIATFVRHSSLIRLRRDFIAEMLKTAEDL